MLLKQFVIKHRKLMQDAFNSSTDTPAIKSLLIEVAKRELKYRDNIKDETVISRLKEALCQYE